MKGTPTKGRGRRFLSYVMGTCFYINVFLALFNIWGGRFEMAVVNCVFGVICWCGSVLNDPDNVEPKL